MVSFFNVQATDAGKPSFPHQKKKAKEKPS
jgi:hypothetical protein